MTIYCAGVLALVFYLSKFPERFLPGKNVNCQPIQITIELNACRLLYCELRYYSFQVHLITLVLVISGGTSLWWQHLFTGILRVKKSYSIDKVTSVTSNFFCYQDTLLMNVIIINYFKNSRCFVERISA